MNRKKLRAFCAADCGRRTNTPVAKYCSIRCEHQVLYRNRVALLESGRYPASIYSARFIRRYLVEKCGEKCSRCGWAERNVRTGRVMIELEHIDGDWRNTRLDNLTLLCPNCHALTATFKALNRGHGRPGRHARILPSGSGRLKQHVLGSTPEGREQLNLLAARANEHSGE